MTTMEITQTIRQTNAKGIEVYKILTGTIVLIATKVKDASIPVCTLICM
jgi:hypothetical protein